MTEPKDDPRMLIPLPGGRTARVPVSVLEPYADAQAVAAHSPAAAPRELQPRSQPVAVPPAGSVVINIFTSSGHVAVERSSPPATADGGDVVAHSLSTDAVTGASVWHTDWEYGECVVTDDYGFPRVEQAWHRHPLGTDYAEIMR